VHLLLDESLRRPIDVCFDAAGSLFVVDFCEFEMSDRGVAAQAGTGAVVRAELG
jgi:hypothetical protein